MRAAGCKPLKREPSEAVSESQNLKRESKSLILSLELTQRADFAPRAYTEESRLRAWQKYFFDKLQNAWKGVFCAHLMRKIGDFGRKESEKI